MKDLRITWFFLGLSFVVLILYTCAMSQTFIEKEILKLIPNSEITWSRELPEEIVNFKVSGDCIAIMTQDGDQRQLTFVNFRDSVEWSISEELVSFLWYDLIGKSDEKLLILTGKGRDKAYVFNNKGKELFKLVKNIGGLYSSPNGKFFYTKLNMDSYDRLRVYNEIGEELWSLRTPVGDWQAEALSDSELIYSDIEYCYLFNAFTGKENWKIRLADYWPLIKGLPEFVCSCDGNYFVVFDSWELFSFDKYGNLLWKKEEPYYLRTTLSKDGQFIAVYRSSEKEGKVLSFFDNLNGGMMIWSRIIDTEEEESNNTYGGLILDDETLYLIPGIINYYFFTGATPSMATFYFKIDQNTGKLLKTDKFNGVFQMEEGTENKAYLLTTDKSGHKGLLRIEVYKNEN